MAMSKGCTITLIIVGVIALLIAIGGWWAWSNKDKLVEAGVSKVLDATATEIKKDMPDGYDDASVDQVMADFKAAVKEKKISAATIQPLAQYFQNAMADEVLDKEEGAKILGMMLDAMGQAVPEPVDIPVDSTAMAVPDSA